MASQYTEPITITLTPEQREKLDQAAYSEHANRSEYVRMILRMHIERLGWTWPEAIDARRASDQETQS